MSDTPAAGRESVAVVLFDGVCNLCNGTIDFLLRRDRRDRLRFASLQSPAGRRLTDAHGITTDPPESMVLIDEGGAHVRSDAALRIARRLGGFWGLVGATGRILPRSLRDAAYNWVARNRYRWFGTRDSCRLPTPEEADRFLEAGERPGAAS